MPDDVMYTMKITDKEITSQVKADLYLLIAQTEEVEGVSKMALRRMALQTFLEGCGVENVLSDERDGKAYTMAWGIDTSGHPTLTLTEKEETTV